MTEKPFADLLADAHESALKLELRDTYMTTDPAYLGWQAGKGVEWVAEQYREWSDIARRTVDRGVAMKRVRVVTVPATDYIRFEHAVTHAVNVSAGEQMRWLNRADTEGLSLPDKDFWLIDGRTVMWLTFSDDGDLIGEDVTDYEGAAAVCTRAFDEAWSRGTDHAAFRL